MSAKPPTQRKHYHNQKSVENRTEKMNYVTTLDINIKW